MLEEFNFERFTTSEVFKEKGVGNNICSDFILRTDYDIKERGLFLDIHWYDTIIDKQTVHEKLDGTDIILYHAGREIGRRIALVSSEEIKHDIYEITVDGKPIIWNDDDEIINGRLFALQEDLLVKDKEKKCRVEKAVEIFDNLKMEHPHLTNESICELFGYTPKAYTFACTALGLTSPFSENPLPTIEEEEQQKQLEAQNSSPSDKAENPQLQPVSAEEDEWANIDEDESEDDDE